jgi:hypothetical protein
MNTNTSNVVDTTVNNVTINNDSKEQNMKTIAFNYVGVKSGYLGYQTESLKGTIYVPKGFFEDNKVAQTFSITSSFAEPKATAPKVAELTAEIEKLKAELAARTSTIVSLPEASVTGAADKKSA